VVHQERCEYRWGQPKSSARQRQTVDIQTAGDRAVPPWNHPAPNRTKIGKLLRWENSQPRFFHPATCDVQAKNCGAVGGEGINKAMLRISRPALLRHADAPALLMQFAGCGIQLKEAESEDLAGHEIAQLGDCSPGHIDQQIAFLQ
jgi:hypothetical protein